MNRGERLRAYHWMMEYSIILLMPTFSMVLNYINLWMQPLD